MTILITGGSKCGKSSVAESLLDGVQGAKFYIAAMEPFGEDARRAIERHCEMRRGKGFQTVECPRNIGDLRFPDGQNGCALLECLTTLCANEMFTPNGVTDPEEKILSGLASLSGQVGRLVVVTNEVSSDGIEYPPETMRYIRTMSRLNAAAAQFADVVIECVCGIPVTLKGAVK